MIQRIDGAPAEDVLTWLEEWYARQCNGVWEHSHGIAIDTLDNPGWRIVIDLTATALADRQPESTMGEREIGQESKQFWIRFNITGQKFVASCGPGNLKAALELFRAFATAEE